MLIAEAQADIRRAYVGGGPGAVVSALVWLASAAAMRLRGVDVAFATLFFGGMLIFPLGKLVCRVGFGRAGEATANPLGRAALESTIAMIGGLLAAWLFLSLRPQLVLPLAAVAVGMHYMVFRTVYGDGTFWLLAALITAIGLAGIFVPGASDATAVMVALAELTFGIVLTVRARHVA